MDWNSGALVVAVVLALANGALGMAVLSPFRRRARALGDLVDRLLAPYDYTKDFYFGRDFAEKPKGGAAK